MDYYKSNQISNKNENENIIDQGLLSFDDLYDSYQSFCNASMYVNNTSTSSMIVSKHYFENYISNELKQFIQFEKFIGVGWFES